MSVAEVADKIINSHDTTIEPSLCSRFRTPKSDCSKCVEICPAQAISVSDKGVEIAGQCSDCGVCISVCPNGAFGMKGSEDKKIINDIRSRVKAKDSKVFRISCRRGDPSADLISPCLGRLIEAMLIEPLKCGISTIEVLQPECKDCPDSKASRHIERLINNLSSIFDMTGIGRESLAVKRMPLQGLSKKPEQAVSRREFFSVFRAKAAEAAAAALPEVGTEPEQKKSFLEIISDKGIGNPKRSLLIESLAGLESLKEISLPSADAMLAELEVSSKCTGCGVCATLCPSGALAQKWEDESFSLSFRPSLCANCGICAATCMPGALKIKETARLNSLLEDAEIRLFEAKRKTCVICRLDFVGSRQGSNGDSANESNICPLCIDRRRKQMALVENGFFKSGG